MQVATDISAIGKHHNALYIVLDQDIIEQRKLFAGGGDIDFLIHCICGNTFGGNLYRDRVVGPGFCETQNFWSKGGRKQQCLALFKLWR